MKGEEEVIERGREDEEVSGNKEGEAMERKTGHKWKQVVRK